MKNKFIFERLREEVEWRYVDNNYGDVTDYEFKWRRYDFINLAKAINDKIKLRDDEYEDISFETIKRIFTDKFQVPEKIHKTKRGTLDKLCIYINCYSWNDFAARYLPEVKPKEEIIASDVERTVNLIVEIMHEKKKPSSKSVKTTEQLLDYYKTERLLISEIWQNSLKKIYRKEQKEEKQYAYECQRLRKILDKHKIDYRVSEGPIMLGKINLERIGKSYKKTKRKPKWKR